MSLNINEIKYRLKYLHHVDVDDLDSQINKFLKQYHSLKEDLETANSCKNISALFDILFRISCNNIPKEVELFLSNKPHSFSVANCNSNFKAYTSYYNYFSMFQHCLFNLLVTLTTQQEFGDAIKIGACTEALNTFGFFDINSNSVQKQETPPVNATTQIEFDTEVSKAIYKKTDSNPDSMWHHYKRNYLNDCNSIFYSRKKITQISYKDSSSVRCFPLYHNWVSLLLSELSFLSLDRSVNYYNKKRLKLKNVASCYNDAYEKALLMSTNYCNSANTYVFNYLMEDYFGHGLLALLRNFNVYSPNKFSDSLHSTSTNNAIRLFSEIPELDSILEQLYLLPPFIRNSLFLTIVSTYESCSKFKQESTSRLHQTPQPKYSSSTNSTQKNNFNDSTDILNAIKSTNFYIIPLFEDIFNYCTLHFYSLILESTDVKIIANSIKEDYNKYLNSYIFNGNKMTNAQFLSQNFVSMSTNIKISCADSDKLISSPFKKVAAHQPINLDNLVTMKKLYVDLLHIPDMDALSCDTFTLKTTYEKHFVLNYFNSFSNYPRDYYLNSLTRQANACRASTDPPSFNRYLENYRRAASQELVDLIHNLD